MEPVVEVEGLVKRYGATPAVDGLSFKVERGSITAVLGPNGAGKTTTVECCEGYRRPDAGSVRVLGRDPLRQGADLRPRIGVMLQNGGIYSGVRAEEMLRHMARLYAHPLDVPMLIERLGLGPAGHTPYRRLSGGQQQRLSLAMAMVGRPELVFLDEPTAGLDPQARRAAWELLEEVRRDGVTVVLTTHLMDEAERLSDRVVIIDHGRVVTTGTPAELTAGSARVVCFNGPSGLDRAALSAALPSPVRVEEDGRGRYTIEGDIGPELLAALTAWCAEQGVMPEGLQVGRRTLEEVFLELTGRWLRE
jgi:ABC-2 type transport system ATP-binding protein